MMQLDKKTIRYFKKKNHGGKTAFARAIDQTLGGFAVCFLLFCTFWLMRLGLKKSIVLAVFVSLFFGGIFWAVRQNRLQKFIQKEVSARRKDYIFEKLLIQNKTEYREFCQAILEKHNPNGRFFPRQGGIWEANEKHFTAILDNHPQSHVTVQQVTALLRLGEKTRANKLSLFSVAPLEQNAQIMCHHYGIYVFDSECILHAAEQTELCPSDAEILDMLHAEIDVSLSDVLRTSILAPGKQKAYILCALVSAVWSLIAGFHILFPLVACLCILLVVLSRLSFKKKRAQPTSDAQV